GHDVVGHRHDVVEGAAAPVAVDLVDELLPVARRAARIGHHHDVAGGGEYLRVPAIRPTVAPESLGAAVDQHQHRVLAVLLKAVRLHHETLHPRALRAIHPEL